MTPAETPIASDAVKRPSGRAQITAAVLEAAADMFSERGLEGTSVRDIAARAGVQHSVVHRYFGTKEHLYEAVIERGAQADRERVDYSGDTATMIKDGLADTRWIRAVMWGALEGRDMREYFTESRAMTPVMQGALRGDYRDAEACPAVDPRVVGAFISAATFGWIAMGPALVTAYGIDGLDEAELNARTAVLISGLLAMADPSAI